MWHEVTSGHWIPGRRGVPKLAIGRRVESTVDADHVACYRAISVCTDMQIRKKNELIPAGGGIPGGLSTDMMVRGE